MLDLLFRLASLLALAGWLALAASPLVPRLKPAVRKATGLVLPALLGLAYLVLVALNWGSAEGGYGSMAEIRALFDTQALLVAGWLHYLAFDLFVGTWIAREGERAGLSHFLLLPCLMLTFLFGPAGLLLFLALRAGFGRPSSSLALEA
jgi:Domain of unknown function (DUF4281)